MLDLGRRRFITLLGGAAAASPLAAHAQQSAMPVVGYLDGGSPGTSAHVVAAIGKGLSETGYVEGRDVVIEYRWAEGNYDRLPVLVSDLVRRQVAVIIAMGTPVAFAAKAATSTIPIVFGGGIDPVKAGLVASLHRPGANVTGVTSMNAEIETKRLGLLNELLPRATRFAVLVNPNSPLAEFDIKDAPPLSCSRSIHRCLPTRSRTSSPSSMLIRANIVTVPAAQAHRDIL
jgi:putative ABC transport system substrate-binding protein